jgi:hypothetical protein
MLVMANCSLARSRVDIAFLAGHGGAPDAARRESVLATTPAPREQRHHPEAVSAGDSFACRWAPA